MKERSAEREREAWQGGVDSADRILRETIRKALNTMDQKSFMKWLRSFVS